MTGAFVAAGAGSRAQWYRNIEADPQVTIQTADGVGSVRAERVTDGETLLRLLDLVKRREGLLLNMYLDALDVSPDRENILIKKDRFYWLSFEPTDEPAPAPMPADLASGCSRLVNLAVGVDEDETIKGAYSS